MCMHISSRYRQLELGELQTTLRHCSVCPSAGIPNDREAETCYSLFRVKNACANCILLLQDFFISFHLSIALFPGPARLSLAVRNSCRIPYCKRRMHRVWERGYYLSGPHSHTVWRETFEGENFRELVKIRFSQRKLSWIARFYNAKECHAPNFVEKTFAYSHKTVKFAKVFSLESFLLYGTFRVHMICMQLVSPTDCVQPVSLNVQDYM